MHCSEFTEADREIIFDSFWKELNWDEKQVYVMSMVDRHDVKQRTVEDKNSRRMQSFVFHLKKQGQKLRVCKEFFLATLNLGEWSLYSWVKKANDAGCSSLPNIASQVASKKRSQVRYGCAERQEFVVKFLNSLPKKESHYCRTSSSKLYLEPVWKSQAELYREYCMKCEEEHLQTMNRVTFGKAFDNLNLLLFTPKKDQCDLCCLHDVGNADNEDYESHLLKKELAA